VLAGATLVGIPFLRQYWIGSEIEARIAVLQPAVDQADRLRRQLIANSAGNDAIAAEELRLGEPLQALSALTQLIPDDTFLTVLTLHERMLAIDGQSASAARLIGLLSTDPVIRNAAFAAPVTRSEDGADMFSLKAEVRS
jgi:general secretion pathway protein L